MAATLPPALLVLRRHRSTTGPQRKRGARGRLFQLLLGCEPSWLTSSLNIHRRNPMRPDPIRSDPIRSEELKRVETPLA
jgi:hypothetical protein